jgi:hypothetical protein
VSASSATPAFPSKADMIPSMFNLSKKLRKSRKSPYAASGAQKNLHNDDYGSTVSLPNLETCTSAPTPIKAGEHIYPPKQNSRIDPDAPLRKSASKSPIRRTRVANRPKTFYRLIGPEGLFGSELKLDDEALKSENGPSPVALPHKALALLGIHEATGFGTPSTPEPWDQDLIDEFGDDDCSSPMNVPLHTLLDRPPECVYFRPQSLCSSFSIRSDNTLATTTTATSITTISPSIKPDYEDAESIERSEISMLNLDDSDDETPTVETVSEKRKTRRLLPKNKKWDKTKGFPLEIALKVCEYFVTETHHEDMDEDERNARCPNCDVYALWSLSQVNKTWSQAANTMLYGCVSLDFGYYSAPARDVNGEGIPPTFVPYTNCCSHDGNPLHTKLDVNAKLQLLYRTIWDSQDDIAARIRGIKLPRRLFSVTKYPLSAVLQKCPNLEFVDHAVTSGSTKDLITVLSNLKQIKRWAWKREHGVKYETNKVKQNRLTDMIEEKMPMNGPPAAIALRVIPSWKHLSHLELNNLRRIEIPDEFDFHKLPALESVALRNLCIVDTNAETGFLERLPALKRLEIDKCLFISAERIVSYLQQKGSDLTHLALHNSVVPIHMLYQLLEHIPSIVDLSVSNGPADTPFSDELTPATPIQFSRELPRLQHLKRVSINMRPLRRSLAFLLDLSESANSAPALHTMRLGFGASGKGPQLGRGSRSMDGDEMRMEFRLRTECLFNNIQLIFSE